MQVAQLLSDITQQRRVMDQAREQYGAVLAPDFLVLDYLRTDEMGLSRILADLLDPLGSHHQGDLFLQKFLRHVFPSEETSSFWMDSLRNAKNIQVSTEVPCHASGTQRRMDILLTWQNNQGETFALCIENKPYAGDQIQQLADYLNELKIRKYRHLHLLYLSGDGTDPSENSLPTDHADEYRRHQQLSTQGYSNLIDWLRSCRMDCRSERVAHFLREIELFIERVFKGIKDMSEAVKIQEIITQDGKALTSAFEISRQIKIVQAQLIVKLQDQLQSILGLQGYCISGKLSSDIRNSTIRFSRGDDFYQGYDMAISFNGFNYAAPNIGLAASENSVIDIEFNEQVYNILKGFSFRGNRPKKSEFWAYDVPIGRHHDTQARYWYDWLNDPQPWAEIIEGTLAEELAAHIIHIDTVLRHELALQRSGSAS